MASKMLKLIPFCIIFMGIMMLCSITTLAYKSMEIPNEDKIYIAVDNNSRTKVDLSSLTEEKEDPPSLTEEKEANKNENVLYQEVNLSSISPLKRDIVRTVTIEIMRFFIFASLIESNASFKDTVTKLFAILTGIMCYYFVIEPHVVLLISKPKVKPMTGEHL